MIPLIGTCQQRSAAWFLWGILLSSLLFYFAGMVDCDKCNSTKSLPSTGKLCPHQISNQWSVLPHHYASSVDKALKLVNLMVLGFIKLQRLPTLFSKYTSFETTTCRQNKEIHWFNFCSCEDNAKKFASYQINIKKIFSSFISLCEWSQKFMPIFQTIRFPNTIEILQKKNITEDIRHFKIAL